MAIKLLMIKKYEQALSRCLVVSLFFCGILVIPGVGQEIGRPPLSEKDILALATSCKLGELSPSHVVDLIRERGLEFQVTESFLNQLEDAQADAIIVQALKKLMGQSKPTYPSHAPEVGLTPPNSQALGTHVGHPSKLPDERSWPEFLEKVRENAIAYSDDLPNFICTQITARSERTFPGSWRVVDNFVADLTYFEKKENYKIISVADRPAKTSTIENLKGTYSTGEFGTSLLILFHPHTNAKFYLEETDTINGHETVRISYQVPKETAGNTISYNGERKIIAAYRGRCWIDPESFHVVRLEEKSIDIPPDFPITRAERAIDYELRDIGGQKYWLPVRAEILLVEGAVNHYARNVIEFKKYRKYEAEVRIVPE